MATDAARKRELLEEFSQSFRIFALLRINLRVSAFQISGAKHSGRAVPRTSEKDHVEIIFLDQPVQMNIDERQSRTRAPVPQQAILEVLRP